MPEVSRSQLLGSLAAGAAVVVLGALWVRGGADGGAPGPAKVEVRRGGAAGTGRDGGSVVVHVAGAVARPGLYRLRAGTRVGGAVRRAGGATRRADLDALNLAARVEDGRQILVPRRAPGGATAALGAGDGTAAGAAGAPAVPLDLNTATLDQLDTLPGIGPATAEAILAHRQEHGGFGSWTSSTRSRGSGRRRWRRSARR